MSIPVRYPYEYIVYTIDATLVHGAIEWLEQNQDKSLEEVQAASSHDNDPNAEPPALQPGEAAKSLVCNECGKRFRSQAQAEFHASKTEHVDFAESVRDPLHDMAEHG